METKEQAYKDFLHRYVGSEAKIEVSGKIRLINISITALSDIQVMDIWHKIKGLYLRSYSTMTDEEALEFAKIEHPWVEAAYYDQEISGIHTKNKDGYATIYLEELTPAQLAWLLKKGFDVFGLIAKGFAKELVA